MPQKKITRYVLEMLPLNQQTFDLVTPDGKITKTLAKDSSSQLEVEVKIESICSRFIGFHIPLEHVTFNLKSTLAQLGIDAAATTIELDPKERCAHIHLKLFSIDPLGSNILAHLTKGCYVGKLFAADPRRRVRNPDYLLRMFGRFDRDGAPLLLLGGGIDSRQLHIEKRADFTVAHLLLKEGIIEYEKTIWDLAPTFAKGLQDSLFPTRQLAHLHQVWSEGKQKILRDQKMLLVKTLPLHVRTVFARVVSSLLPTGVSHTSANILQPDTKASGDVYELYGSSKEEITQIPLEFYTLEPEKEHVFFSDRDQLQVSLEDPESIFQAFDTAPKPLNLKASVFIVKGEQMLNLKTEHWVVKDPKQKSFPGFFDPEIQVKRVESYIAAQSATPILEAIEKGEITSQGALFSRYFPSPLMKKILLGRGVQHCLRRIYFQYPSRSHGKFFSHEDRSFLLDLAKFAIDVFWADPATGRLLQFCPKPKKDTGMFVPPKRVEEFARSTAFGVYGSTLLSLQFEEELKEILASILILKEKSDHPLLNPKTPLSLITGGGPGLMEVGNRVARSLGILSCANIVDLKGLEQEQNAYLDAIMTYRVDRLVERQGEFNLDFPIFLMGGFGTDFELALETIRRKVHVGPSTPVLLLGPKEYWEGKISSPHKTNIKSGTIKDSEWVSNCFFCIENGANALKVYEKFFAGTLPIGPDHPPAPKGFVAL